MDFVTCMIVYSSAHCTDLHAEKPATYDVHLRKTPQRARVVLFVFEGGPDGGGLCFRTFRYYCCCRGEVGIREQETDKNNERTAVFFPACPTNGASKCFHIASRPPTPQQTTDEQRQLWANKRSGQQPRHDSSRTHLSPLHQLHRSRVARKNNFETRLVHLRWFQPHWPLCTVSSISWNAAHA